MNSTKDIKKAMNLLLEPIGLKARTFVVDYQDDKNNCLNVELTSIVAGDDEFIANSIIVDIEARKGFVVYSIYEILNGYVRSEIEPIILRDPQEARKHIKLLYLDLRKERVCEDA